MPPRSLRLRLYLPLFLILPGSILNLKADTELNIPGYRIHWYDEFEETAVDTSKWEVNVGVNAWYQRLSDGRFVEPHWFGDEFEPWIAVGSINDERQYYSPDNVTVAEGVLEIRADREEVQSPVGWYEPGYHEFTSGKLNTADEFQFQYGIVKWRAQLPEGQGLWPALWMLNAPDPWYWDDEIDIMEAKGSLPTRMSSAHHFKVEDANGNRTNFYNTNEVDVGVNLQTSFHEYSLEWDADSILTRIDGNQVLYDEQAIPQDPMFLIMNAAVGGRFDGVPGPDVAFPTYFKIDWVRVWQEASTPSDLASGGFEEFQGPQWANWNTVDDGNLSVYTTGALHGHASVLIDRPSDVAPPSEPSNLFTDGTAGGWSAWLNELDAEGDVTSSGSIDPTSIPATVNGDSATLSIHQTAPSARANAVIYRQVDGIVAQGSDLTYTGTVMIDEAFPSDSEAIAFIRIFGPNFQTFTDVTTSVKIGGDFTLQASVPSLDVPAVQIGLETTGSTGSAGQLTAINLFVSDAADGGATPDNRTGFTQTVVAIPGQTVNYGLLAANHPGNPLGPSAEGRLKLEFLDASENIISETSTIVVSHESPAHPVPYAMEAVAPANASYARLSIERISLDIGADTTGSFIADAAYLHVPGTTELPTFTSGAPASLTVNAGEPVDLEVNLTSPTALAYQWYHDGIPVSTSQNYAFSTTPDSGGVYFLVASNDAGPVVGQATELTVLTPDSDGDLIPDFDETTLYGTDPDLADTDGDGVSDYAELFLLLTDPLDAQSVMRISQFTLSGDSVEITFQSSPGVSYVPEASADLGTWQALGQPFTATGSESTITRTVPVTDPVLSFFRIKFVENDG